MTKNYIGLTGVTSASQSMIVISLFDEKGINMKSEIIPMIGILISPRNLDPEWYSNRYPNLKTIGEIIEAIKGKCFLTLHIDSKSEYSWCDDLFKLCEKIPKEFDGFQINVKHPNVSDLQRIKEKYPNKEIIMQYSDDFITMNTYDALDSLNQYIKYVDNILIDPSRGRGLEIKIDEAIKHYNLIHNAFHHIKIGFAGGFNPNNIETYTTKFNSNIGQKTYSTDVESGVRDQYDRLDLTLFEKYLTAQQQTDPLECPNQFWNSDIPGYVCKLKSEFHCNLINYDVCPVYKLWTQVCEKHNDLPWYSKEPRCGCDAWQDGDESCDYMKNGNCHFNYPDQRCQFETGWIHPEDFRELGLFVNDNPSDKNKAILSRRIMISWKAGVISEKEAQILLEKLFGIEC